MRLRSIWRGFWYSMPMEVGKGAIKGQLIRVFKPARYRQLKKIRPNRRTLVKEKNLAIEAIKRRLIQENIRFIKVYGRVKTLGSKNAWNISQTVWKKKSQNLQY